MYTDITSNVQYWGIYSKLHTICTPNSHTPYLLVTWRPQIFGQQGQKQYLAIMPQGHSFVVLIFFKLIQEWSIFWQFLLLWFLQPFLFIYFFLFEWFLFYSFFDVAFYNGDTIEIHCLILARILQANTRKPFTFELFKYSTLTACY